MSAKADKRKIRYTQSSDGSSAYAFPDFSSALKQNQMGIALCFQNPLEDKMCQKHLLKIDRMRKRQEVILYHMQKNFFIQQVFEKKLNPYMKRGEEESDTENKENHSNLQKTKARREGSPKKKVRALPFLRSHTLADIPNAIKEEPDKEQDDHTARTNTNKDQKEAKERTKRGPVLPILSQSTPVGALDANKSRSMPIINSDGYGYGGLLPPLEEEDFDIEFEDEYKRFENTRLNSRPSNTGGKRSIKDIKKNPDSIFPKLKELVAKGPMEKQPEIYEPVIREVKPFLKPRPATRPETKKDDKSRYVKMIQRLTAHLPDQLLETAKEQVRIMSNSDAIYEKKKKLLEENKELCDQNPLAEDERWSNLESSLCPTHGLSLKWRRVPGKKWAFR